MHRRIGFLVLLLSTLCWQASHAQEEQVEAASRGLVGSPAPRMVLKTIDGQSIDLGALYGKKAVYLKFWATWCESYLATSRPSLSANCRAVREQVEQLAKGERARWLGVASGIWASKDDVRKYRGKYGVTIPVTLDESGELFRAFRVMNVPTLVVIDAQGRVERRIEGSNANVAEALQAALKP